MFLKGLLGATATATLTAATVNAAPVCPPVVTPNCESDIAAQIRFVKRETRFIRRVFKPDIPQAHYAADSRIYALAWRQTGGILTTLYDRPAFVFPTEVLAWNFAVKHNLYCYGDVVVARQICENCD
jgi:hypothetical protein